MMKVFLTKVTSMSKPFPALCKDCKYSLPEERSEWCLRCHHPLVNAKDHWALAAASGHTFGNGTACNSEREAGWFKPCGIKGKLWEQKVQ